MLGKKPRIAPPPGTWTRPGYEKLFWRLSSGSRGRGSTLQLSRNGSSAGFGLRRGPWPQIEQLLKEAEGDWKGLILSGYFTGGRLVDLARLTWGDIDLSEKTITFVQRKTGSAVQVPIHQDLYEYLLELPCSDRPKKPVFPKLFDKPGAGKSGLSMSFKRLMERAGIDDGVARKKDGKLGRNVSRLSFHSLRHSFNSAMANADVPLEIRQKLTGHASKDMNKHYTHLELATVRRAVESISRLPGKAADAPH